MWQLPVTRTPNPGGRATTRSGEIFAPQPEVPLADEEFPDTRDKTRPGMD